METNIHTNKHTNKQTMKQSQPIIVSLDIGNKKNAAISGRKNEFCKTEILCFWQAQKKCMLF